ncbi:MAG: hypothetical protein PHG44_04375 [Lentisphaeria bacterium]|jgi:hypothetical protein|nr:hypothetical protein [Lentisphaeria bacterium]MDY0176558.1 hypothetical protein [Lentisphaeria bacterium]
MNKKLSNSNLLVVIFLALGAISSLQARSVTVKMRDIDRALLVSDMVLRSLFPAQQTVVVQQAAPVYSAPLYSAPVYSSSVTTTVINPSVFTTPLYVAPSIHYIGGSPRYSPPRYSAPRYSPPPRRYSAPQRPAQHRPGRQARPARPRR